MNLHRIVQASLAAGVLQLAAASIFPLAAFSRLPAADAPTDAAAGEKIYAGPEIVVTASRIEWPVEKTASFITVLSGDDIRMTRAANVGEILRAVPGLIVAQSGSQGNASSLFIRGAASNHCLVLLDGVPLNDPTTGAFDFSDLDAAAVERIEVVRGPHGILYGSSAIGGVVNIITTPRAEGAKRSVSLAGGSFRSAEGAVSLSGGEKSYRYSYSLSGTTSDGLGANDFHRALTFSGAVSSAVTAASSVSMSLRYREADMGLRGPRFDFDPDAGQKGGHFLVSALYRQFVSSVWSYSLRTSFLSREITWNDPLDSLDTSPYAGDGFSEINSRVANAAWQNDLRLANHVWVTGGAEWKEEETVNSGYSSFGTTTFDDRIASTSLFANAIADFAKMPTASAGLRLDDHSKFGAVTTYKLSLSFPVAPTGTTLKASVGTGFRAPSLNELYYPGYGNPSLAPEKTEGWDCGIRQDFGRGRVSVECAYFNNSYRNLITFDPATWLAGNVGEATSDGVEIQSSARPAEALTLRGFYTFTRTEDRATGKQLLRRPRHSGGASASYRRGSFDVLLASTLVGARLDNDFGGPLGEHFNERYATFDCAVAYRFSPSRELYCKLRNVADARYDEVAGYPSPGASVMAGTRIDF